MRRDTQNTSAEVYIGLRKFIYLFIYFIFAVFYIFQSKPFHHDILSLRNALKGTVHKN